MAKMTFSETIRAPRGDVWARSVELDRWPEQISGIEKIERVGGAPVIIKLLEGTQGVGVILAESNKVAEAIVETLQSAKQNVLIQKFVAESKGKDIRAFVVGDRVVAAMRRVAQGQEFRSNVHRGGSATAVELSDEYKETAVRAARPLSASRRSRTSISGMGEPIPAKRWKP